MHVDVIYANLIIIIYLYVTRLLFKYIQSLTLDRVVLLGVLNLVCFAKDNTYQDLNKSKKIEIRVNLKKIVS